MLNTKLCSSVHALLCLAALNACCRDAGNIAPILGLCEADGLHGQLRNISARDAAILVFRDEPVVHSQEHLPLSALLTRPDCIRTTERRAQLNTILWKLRMRTSLCGPHACQVCHVLQMATRVLGEKLIGEGPHAGS